MLYLVATPIGNLGDITLRAIELLRSCDAVYCEDTRHTLQLLNHLEIKKPLVSCHKHNERSRASEICTLLKEGKEIVYVSDAGMPGISDPGEVLVQACQKEGLPCTVIPGASAVLTAAVLSGFPVQPFTFWGFLTREGKKRREEIEQLHSINHLVILYESPFRVRETLHDLLIALGDVPCTVVRELTKKYEEVKHGSLSELISYYEEPPKGECVICLIPGSVSSSDTEVDPEQWMISNYSAFSSVRDLAAAASNACSIPKRKAYQIALALFSNKE
jgi:16S rRNA (cytidine1402-2'-O)-methyltransferase